MNLHLYRTESDVYGTFGILVGEGAKQILYTCEAPWQGRDAEKEYPYGKPFKSCISAGKYDLRWENSPKYGWAWHLVSEGVYLSKRGPLDRFACLLHSANFPESLMGCLALGTFRGSVIGRYGVGNSEAAMQKFHRWLETGERHTLTIR